MIPAEVEPLVRRLWEEYRSVGLFPDDDLPGFTARVAGAFEPSELEEWLEEEEDGPDEDTRRLRRHDVLATLQGIRHDWRFDAEDVLSAAAERLSARGLRLGWGEERVTGEVREVPLWLEDGDRLVWRFSTLDGLLRGVNHLLAARGPGPRFVGLETGSDCYDVALLDPGVDLGRSPLFRLHWDRDPVLGPAGAPRPPWWRRWWGPSSA